MMRVPVLLAACLALLPVAAGQTTQPTTQPTTEPAGSETGGGLLPRVEMETSMGTIVLELDGEKAPITVLNFLRYAEEGYYDGTIFHRVMKDFMIQGGGFNKELDKKMEGLHDPIANEWQNGLKNVKGSIAMARLGRQPDSATSQFFINTVDNPFLDQPRDGAGYAVFGKVVEGQEVVEAIRATPVTENPKLPMGPVVPETTVEITSVKVQGEYDRATLEKNAVPKPSAEDLTVEAHVRKLEKELGKEGRKTPTGLWIITVTEGEGESPSRSDTVEVHYTGWLLDGTKFDSSVDRGRPATFPLNRVIAGWTEGVGLMKPGEKARLIIPSKLAYGVRGSPPRIPPNSPLEFEVELLSIK